MGFVVYDHGYRIKTPSKTQYPPRGVSQLSETKPIHRSADVEDKVHADGPHFELTLWEESQKRKTAAQAYSDTDEQAPPTPTTSAITASQIMSHPVHSVNVNSNVRSSWQLMQQHELHYLVVVGNENQPLGVISDRMLLKHGTESFDVVGSLITRKLMAAKATTDVRRIAATLIKHNITCMPVVDEDDHVIGVVCRSDLLRLLVSGAHAEDWA